MHRASSLLVSFFDAHAWARPLLGTAALGSSLQFLGTPESYRAFRRAGKPVLSGRFQYVPLVEAEAALHKFWAPYLSVTGGPGPADAREWLAPVRCLPRGPKVQFLAPALGRRPAEAVDCHLAVWLWPFGWASQMELELKGPLTLGEIEHFRAAVLDPLTDAFQPAAGQGKGLVGVFRRLAKDLTFDVLPTGAFLADEVLCSRFMVMGHAAVRGEPFDRFDVAAVPANAADGLMPDADCARLLALVAENPRMLTRAEGSHENPFALAVLRLSDYALTHPQKGMLVMMRHHQDSAWRRRRQLCLLRNLRLSALVSAALRGLDRSTAVSAEHQVLIDAGRTAQSGLRRFYTNPAFLTLAGRV